MSGAEEAPAAAAAAAAVTPAADAPAADAPAEPVGVAPTLPETKSALEVLASGATEVRDEDLMSPAGLDEDEEEGEAEMLGMRLGTMAIAKANTQARESKFTQHGSTYVPHKAAAAGAGGGAAGAAAAAPAASKAAAPAAAAAVAYDGSKHSAADLRASKPDGEGPIQGINFGAKELYLTDSEFADIFKMAPAAFAAQPKWKKDEQKKKAGLF